MLEIIVHQDQWPHDAVTCRLEKLKQEEVLVNINHSQQFKGYLKRQDRVYSHGLAWIHLTM